MSGSIFIHLPERPLPRRRFTLQAAVLIFVGGVLAGALAAVVGAWM